MNVYMTNRQKRQLEGKEIVPEEIARDKVCEWVIKCLLTYGREIENNEELDFIVRYLNDWNVDVMALVKSRFLDPRIKLDTLAVNYFSVEILYVLWTQNIVKFNAECNNFNSSGSNTA